VPEAAKEVAPRPPLARLTTALLLERGVASHRQGRISEAAAAYRELLSAEPDNADALHLLGVALAQGGPSAEAVDLIRAAIRQHPGSPMAHFNLGKALYALERHEEALASYEQALILRPHYVEALGERGNVLGTLRHHAEALASFERVLALEPGHVTARFNSGLIRLLRGEFGEGFRLYETRFEMDEQRGPARRLAQPPWRGRESLAGKAILLWGERGLGDTIQFSRYASRVRALGAQVTLEVLPCLKALLGSQFPGIRVTAQGESAGPFDYQCPLLSLPLAFGTALDSVPADRTYLRADPARIASWSRRLPRTSSLKVGIAWQGNLEAEKNWARGRSIPLAAFAPVVRESAICAVSLQAPEGAGQLAASELRDRIIDFGEALDEGPDAFLDTAAVIANLDLVISADTSIAHLAGALGVPVWVALHTSSEWRWLLERRDSPWYPSMRLFRQTRAGDWSSVFGEIARELELWAQAPAPPARAVSDRAS
jgi:tetratricopeptide (TPR) repeat protein